MTRLMIVALFAATASLAMFGSGASGQAVCPDGKLAKTLKDCGPTGATAKKQGKNTATPDDKGFAAKQGTQRAVPFMKMPDFDISSDPGPRSDPKPPPKPKPKEDCMSCAD